MDISHAGPSLGILVRAQVDRPLSMREGEF